MDAVSHGIANTDSGNTQIMMNILVSQENWDKLVRTY